ncbi:unnamed protein product, partial [Didymodactylos carnosus]
MQLEAILKYDVQQHLFVNNKTNSTLIFQEMVHYGEVSFYQVVNYDMKKFIELTENRNDGLSAILMEGARYPDDDSHETPADSVPKKYCNKTCLNSRILHYLRSSDTQTVEYEDGIDIQQLYTLEAKAT